MNDVIRHRFPGLLAALALASGCAGGGPTAGSADGSATPLFVELTVVNDHSRYQDLGDATEANTNAIIELVNGYVAASSEFTRYAPRIVLVAQRTITTSEEDPLKGVAVDSNGDVVFLDALDKFAVYRSAHLNTPRYANDAAILLTHRKGSDSTITLAYTWQVCNPNASAAVVEVNHTLAFDASSVAHVLGHLLGMCHDPPVTRTGGSPGCRTLAPEELGATCANRIMAATSDPSAVAERFSRCSAEDLNDFVDNRMGIPNCLTNPALGVAMSTVEAVKPER